MEDIDRRGLGFGALAYLLWAVFPLYFELLKPAGSAEVIGHRILWSAVFCAVLISILHGWRGVRAALGNRRLAATLACAGAIVALNWLLYVYAVLTDQVVEASLGYFVNPLVTILLGVIFLGERPRRAVWVALGVGFVAVLVITIGYGRFPWIALGLAFSFGFYGLVKKQAGRQVSALPGLFIETAAMTPIALAYLVYLQIGGQAHLTGYGNWHVAALMFCGVVTALPLLLFNAAARRLPLTAIGLLQYICPIGQFLIGVVIFGEAMSVARWIGFALIWVALVIVSVDTVRAARASSAGTGGSGTDREPDLSLDAAAAGP